MGINTHVPAGSRVALFFWDCGISEDEQRRVLTESAKTKGLNVVREYSGAITVPCDDGLAGEFDAIAFVLIDDKHKTIFGVDYRTAEHFQTMKAISERQK